MNFSPKIYEKYGLDRIYPRRRPLGKIGIAEEIFRISKAIQKESKKQTPYNLTKGS